MGSDSKKFYGALGRADLLFLDPEKVVVVTDKDHPLWDERAEMPVPEKMIASIMRARTVYKPIIVRRNGVDRNGEPIVEVVDGRQRVRATRIVNHRLKEEGEAILIRVPAITRRDEDKALFEITIAANENATKDSPVVLAKKLKRYLDMGHDLEEAAIVFAKTTTTLKTLLCILDCHENVIKALDTGKIGITHAKTLSALPRQEQAEALATLLKKPEAPGEEPAPIGEQLEDLVGDRGKVRVRNQKTKKDLKKFRKSLESSRSNDADLAIAMIDWFMGKKDALNKFRALKARLEGLEEEAEE